MAACPVFITKPVYFLKENLVIKFTTQYFCIFSHQVHGRNSVCVHACKEQSVCVLQQQEVLERLSTFRMAACDGLKDWRPKTVITVSPTTLPFEKLKTELGVMRLTVAAGK